MGFEPTISALTGRCVKPDYTTGPNGKHYTEAFLFRKEVMHLFQFVLVANRNLHRCRKISLDSELPKFAF
jgi:hypothetical protein